MKKINFSDYEVNIENGTIFSYKRNCFIGNMHPKGYILTTLTDDNGIQHSIKFHRFIWECANGEIPEGFDIHHKNGDKLNNSISNLELMERFEHNHLHKSGENHPNWHKKFSEKTRQKMSLAHKGKQMQAVVQLSLDNKFIRTFDSVNEAAKAVKGNASNISTCMHHRIETSANYKWLTLEEYNNNFTL
jgi:hypothetical protein